MEIKKNYNELDLLIRYGKTKECQELENFIKEINKSCWTREKDLRNNWMLNLTSFMLNHYVEKLILELEMQLKPHDKEFDYLTNRPGFLMEYDFDGADGYKYEAKRFYNLASFDRKLQTNNINFHGADFAYIYLMDSKRIYLYNTNNNTLKLIYDLKGYESGNMVKIDYYLDLYREIKGRNK